MEEKYKFFAHTSCEYYPCHDMKEMNCLFCYCPLYLKEECGGNYQYIGDIKDCSHCLIPHKKENYDYIIKKLKEKP